MTNYSPPSPPDVQPPYNRRPLGDVPPWYVAAAGVVLLVILGLVIAILVRNGDDEQVQTVAPTLPSESTTTADTAGSTTTGSTTDTSATSTSDTTVSSTTDTSASSTSDSTVSSSTTTTVDPDQYASAVWPWFDSSTRYDDPVAAAQGFAEDFIGFDDPVVGPFQQGDTRSGEVEVRPAPDGPVTTVFVRQLGPDDSWWILGSVTANIVVDEPDAIDEIDSPLRVSGKALAFEGTVDVELRADGSNTALIDGFVTGGGTEMAPFDSTFTFTNPGRGAGALLLMTLSAENGQVWEAVVVRVAFAGS